MSIVAGNKALNGQGPHLTCHHAVARRRAASPLQVAKDGYPGFDAGLGLNPVTDFDCVAGAFRDNHNIMRLAAVVAFQQTARHISVEIHLHFGNQYDFCPAGHAHIQRDITSAPAHDLDAAAALMRCGRIAQFVDGTHGRVQCSVIADRVLRTADVIVYGTRYADDRKTHS